VPTLLKNEKQPCNFFVCHVAASKKWFVLVKNSHFANFHQDQRRSVWKLLHYKWKTSFIDKKSQKSPKRSTWPTRNKEIYSYFEL
jgi:hypothetical protein